MAPQASAAKSTAGRSRPAKHLLAKADYKPPKPVERAKRSYTRKRKMEVLLFIENHRVPLERDVWGLLVAPSASQLLAGRTCGRSRRISRSSIRRASRTGGRGGRRSWEAQSPTSTVGSPLRAPSVD
ncbi:hypothetical protein F4802DRAFT_602831 [Xylaria palmicola]|nr:hypothetical protein F4802DRAFT_602831 [Xylaria palmicola]